MIKAKYSFIDTRGRNFTDCSECKFGGNGRTVEKCPKGWDVKTGEIFGCLSGVLLEELELIKPYKNGENKNG